MFEWALTKGGGGAFCKLHGFSALRISLGPANRQTEGYAQILGPRPSGAVTDYYADTRPVGDQSRLIMEIPGI